MSIPVVRPWSARSRPRGEGIAGSEERPHARHIAHAPQPTVRSPDAEREPVPVAGDAERPLPDARRKVAGRAERQPERFQAWALHGRGGRTAEGDFGADPVDESVG
jgi:hypothetical protein